MGCKFCRKKGYERINYLAPDEKEIVLKDYSSQNDALLNILESTNNYFTQVQLVDYVNLLEQFNLETSGVITDEPMHSNFSSKDEFLFKSLSLEEFMNFVVNKILVLDDLSESLEKDNIFIFKQFCSEMYKALESKLKEHYKEDNSFDLIKKRNILAFGILFCTCENIEKMKLFFDIFKNDSDEENIEFTKSKELDDFLITLFLLSSYCVITSRNNIVNEQKGIRKLEKQELLNLLKTCELKNCENLVKVFNDTFFIKEGYNWNEFKKQFEDIDNGFGWVLSSKGIRRKLEENSE